VAAFTPGLDLAEAFYGEAVRPALDRLYPEIVHGAAVLGRGSEVLGFDTPTSMDHDWGPSKLDLFVSADDVRHADAIVAALREELPYVFRGVPTSFQASPDATGGVLQSTTSGPVEHRITVTTPRDFFATYLGVDPQEGLSAVDWLLIPSQRLCTVVSGRIFHDPTGELEEARQLLRWYPRDVWRYVLAAQWRRIDQEEPFMARCGDVGDELGSRVVAARMVHEIMALAFLMERENAPYAKWFGTAFSRLDCAPTLEPLLQATLDGRDWSAREEALSQAFLHLARMHNDLGLAESVEPRIAPFHGRPYRVPHAARFVEALHAAIESDDVRRLPRHLGAVFQLADSTEVLDRIHRCRALAPLYEPGPPTRRLRTGAPERGAPPTQPQPRPA